MNYKSYFVSVFVSCSLLLGCSSDKKNAPPIQRCTKEFIQDYNLVIHGISMTASVWDSQQPNIYRRQMRDMVILDRTCQNFFARHSGIFCLAATEQETEIISADTISPYCATAKDLVQKHNPTFTPPNISSNDESFFENSEIEDLPEVVIEDTISNNSPKNAPKNSQDQNEHELLPVPNIETVPHGTLPTLKAPATQESESSISISDKSLINDLASQKINFVVLNVSSILKTLENRDVVISEGLVDSLQNQKMIQKVQKGQTFCSISSLEKEVWKEHLKDGLTLSVKHLNELQSSASQPFRQLTIALEDERKGLNLSCLKRSSTAFRLGELKKTLTDVLDINIQ